MSQLLLLGNPRKRARKGRKARSPAQRAATARMLAANRSKRAGPARKRRSRRRASVVSAAPARRSRRSAAKVGRRSRRRSSSLRGLMSGSGSGALSMVKSGAIGGAGAVANDILFGLAGKVLPAGWVSPQNADGSTNYMAFAAKAGTAIALGMFGKKVMPGALAAKMADGALTVLAYQLMRPMVPTSIMNGLGYYNPAPTMAPRRLNAYVNTGRPQLSGVGAYVNAQPNATAMQGAAVARMLQSVR